MKTCHKGVFQFFTALTAMSSPNVSQLRNGIVAIVSLNPVASISFLDAEISEAARMIVTGKYVAILSGLVSTACHCTSSYLEFNIRDVRAWIWMVIR
jgi:hypothetical protein